MNSLNQYVFYGTIFDRNPNPNFEEFPKSVPFAIIAENYDEAQRQAIDKLFDPVNGRLNSYSKKDDAPNRFNVCFDKNPIVRPVVWDSNRVKYVYDDEPILT